MGVPNWPGGDTGVVIGIGYDLGSRTRYELLRDWRGLLPRRVLAHLARACGKRGLQAARLIRFYRNIEVPYDAAVTVWRAARR
jgi:hypothetical protein